MTKHPQTGMPINYEDDDRMLARIMREAMPRFTFSPDFNRPMRLTAAQRAEAQAALRRMGKPWIAAR